MKAKFMSQEDAATAAQVRKIIKTVGCVAVCGAGIATLVLSHFYGWLVPVLQAGGIMTLVVVAAIIIDRQVRKQVG